MCVGYSGGGTAPFRRWARVLPENTELVLICHPGRESRFAEPFATTWEELCAPIVRALHEQVDRPFVLFGHSMGAAVAFDVAVRMERAGLRGPSAVVASASEAPTDWAVKLHRPPALSQTDAELLEWMSTVGQLSPELLAEPELVQIALELLRADLTVSADYRYEPGTTVRAPLQVLYGSQDGADAAAQAKRWSVLGAGPVTVTELAGGHFYTPEVWDRLPERFVSLG
ncbi:enantio-pyochelin biosynthetic protein PchC [Kutzneria albida DSM 43870]|uniref:Enantio-pyochelin biosynthetic protein PchC n=1 Tax=Kutzneria albida DSM 43870 TaxID=1449976 RepID=W5VZW7_9PSEU|nr:enantio-pyochelin biosynthetic protein PchC [Kutzneria albida DSM 43870]